MIGIVAPTDYGWYEFLLDRSLPEVNFWTPTDTRPLRAPEFSPFFFKLKKPHYAICGFGYFARWSSLPDWLAWDCFREGNGCTSFTEMQERIGKIRRGIGYRSERSNSNIGCILIVQPVFFPPDAWVRQPADWGKTTVTPTRYDLTTGEGRRIWEECQDRAAVEQLISSSDLLTVRPPRARYGAPQLTTPRLGQGTFRVAVTDAYGRACSVTEEHSLPALEAAHIRSYAHDGSVRVHVRPGLTALEDPRGPGPNVVPPLEVDRYPPFSGHFTVRPGHKLDPGAISVDAQVVDLDSAADGPAWDTPAEGGIAVVRVLWKRAMPFRSVTRPVARSG